MKPATPPKKPAMKSMIPRPTLKSIAAAAHVKQVNGSHPVSASYAPTVKLPNQGVSSSPRNEGQAAIKAPFGKCQVSTGYGRLAVLQKAKVHGRGEGEKGLTNKVAAVERKRILKKPVTAEEESLLQPPAEPASSILTLTSESANPDGILGLPCPSERPAPESNIQPSTSMDSPPEISDDVSVLQPMTSESPTGCGDGRLSNLPRANTSSSPLLENPVPPPFRLEVAVFKCAPLIQEEEGRFFSFMRIENRSRYPIAFRIGGRDGMTIRYRITPAFGCVDAFQSLNVAIWARSDLELTYAVLAADEFFTEVIPVPTMYRCPSTIQWLFEERYYPELKQTFRSFFMKPILIQHVSIQSLLEGLTPPTLSRLATSLVSFQFDNVTPEETEFLKKALSLFHATETVEGMEDVKALMTRGVKYTLLFILGYLARLLGYQFVGINEEDV